MLFKKLSSLFGKVTKEEIEKSINEVKKEIETVAEKTIQDIPKPTVVDEEPDYTPTPAMSPLELESRIENALDEIAGITYEKNVPATKFNAGAHPKAKPVSFLVNKDGASKLAIVVVNKNTYRSRPVTGTMELVEANGINYIRFFTERENNHSYIVNRINENL